MKIADANAAVGGKKRTGKQFEICSGTNLHLPFVIVYDMRALVIVTINLGGQLI